MIKAKKVEKCNGFDCSNCNNNFYDELDYVKKVIIWAFGIKYEICLACFNEIKNSFEEVNCELENMLNEEI